MFQPGAHMPNAQKIELDGPAGLAMNQAGIDFPSLLQAIHANNVSNLSLLHPRGKILFAEGEPARGVHLLRTGRATFPAHWDPKLRIPRGQVVAAASIVSPKY